MKFINKREQAKRLKREADAAFKESDDLLFECFKYKDDETFNNALDEDQEWSVHHLIHMDEWHENFIYITDTIFIGITLHYDQVKNLILL